jgi:tRNA threonylcarbamoyladenosine biosynthesis protein TsaE
VLTALTKSADDTRELASQVATLAKPGDVILLAGELGAGKTAFAQGFGRALGVDEPIVSPTFTLVRTYAGRIPLVHVDVYRLDHLQEVVELGLAELLDEGGVALIEWGDMAAPTLPPDFLEVRLEYGGGLDDGTADAGMEPDDERRISFRIVGPSWAPRQRALHAALSRWSTE